MEGLPMKSPFPGMDPYIEAAGMWPDFHDDLINEIKRALAAALPQRYFVQTGERSYVVLASDNGKEVKPFLPDIGVLSSDAAEASIQGIPQAVAVEGGEEVAGITMHAFIDEHYRENFVEIYEADPEIRLVTCLEVLSPSNKRPGTEGWDQYLRKRNSLLLGQANLVEIDLLRGGRRMPMLEPWPKAPFYILTSRKEFGPPRQVVPAHFNRPLPAVVVPLIPPDPDVQLAMQPMVDAVYQRSRYARRIDYTQRLTPPLSREQKAWLATQLKGSSSPTKPSPRRPRRR
jgi:hypothetical protein